MRNADRRLVAAAVLLVLAVACTKNNNNANTPTTPSCTVTAGTISTSSFAAAGGTGSVPVTAGTGCSWTATSSATFVTITSGASGNGNGTVNFTVAANSGASRTATLAIGGTSFTISQSAAVPGNLSAPAATSPVGGLTVTDTRPTLVVSNATASGTVGTITYRFEISDLPTFPNEPVRTFTADGIAQGSGTTSWQVNRDLGPDVLWYWHARATDGTTTGAYSATETFRTVGPCTFTVSPASFSIGGTGGTIVVTIGGPSTCNWTATSNASFITITPPSSGTGSGSVTASVAANSGAARTGTLTVGGQTVTVNQSAGGAISVSFRMRDPAVSGASPTTECRITSSSGSTCVLESTSFPLGTNGLVKFDWAVQFTDGDVKTFSQSSADSTFSFSWTCGGPQSTTDGVSQPLSVTLTVTDTTGATASASAGSGNQPPLFVRLFKC